MLEDDCIVLGRWQEGALQIIIAKSVKQNGEIITPIEVTDAYVIEPQQRRFGLITKGIFFENTVALGLKEKGTPIVLPSDIMVVPDGEYHRVDAEEFEELINNYKTAPYPFILFQPSQ